MRWLLRFWNGNRIVWYFFRLVVGFFCIQFLAAARTGSTKVSRVACSLWLYLANSGSLKRSNNHPYPSLFTSLGFTRGCSQWPTWGGSALMAWLAATAVLTRMGKNSIGTLGPFLLVLFLFLLSCQSCQNRIVLVLWRYQPITTILYHRHNDFHCSI